jgi:hypothetical protein
LHLLALAALACTVFFVELGIRGAPWYLTLPPLLLPCALLLRGQDRWAVFATVVIGAELLCAHSLWHTFSEVLSVLWYLVIWLNLLPVLLLVAGKRRVGLVGLTLLALPLVPTPVVLLIEWGCIHHEAERLAAYANEHRTADGTAPTLEAYEFRFAWTAAHIRYKPGDPFSLHYSVGNRGTSHWTTDNGASWRYYPD